MLKREEILNAKEIYLSERGEILIPDKERNIGYRFTRHTLCWEPVKKWYSWKVWNQAISGEKALELIDEWTDKAKRENDRLTKAIEFASKKHNGQYRKSTTIPYILHPLEVLQILYSMRAGTNLLIAGVLHDTVEDTDTTLEEISEIFGEEVARLVLSNSEDKSKTWDERKQHTIDELSKAPQDIKMLILADKLSNLRSIACDYNSIGDKLWERFNAPVEKQAWYYDGISDALYDLQFIPECECAYWEFTGLFKDVFVRYYIDAENEIIYQYCISGTGYYLKKGSSEWRPIAEKVADVISENILNDKGKPHFYNVNAVLENATPFSRKDAELTEDIWNRGL